MTTKLEPKPKAGAEEVIFPRNWKMPEVEDWSAGQDVPKLVRVAVNRVTGVLMPKPIIAPEMVRVPLSNWLLLAVSRTALRA